jgi:iron complex outermembrane receptor protein
MAITAFTNKTLVASGITDFRDYAVQVPNLSFAYAGSIASQSQSIAIRGIYGQNTTGMYLDDTPLPETVDPRVLDIDQIEVLKGTARDSVRRSFDGRYHPPRHQPARN